MTRIWILCIAVGTLAWSAWGQKVETEKLDREMIIHLQTAMNHLTVLEMKEPVSAVAVGSPVFKVEWRENKVFIEPMEPAVATNLFVWTSSGRFNYELDPPGEVRLMVFAIDQLGVNPPKGPNSMDQLGERSGPSPADVLLSANPVRLLSPVSEKDRVAVRVTDLLERDGQVLIRYSIRNGTRKDYVPGNPQAVVLKAPRYRESLYALRGSEFGPNETLRLKSGGEVFLEVAKNAIRSSRIEPGQETTGILAVRLPQENTEPLVIRLIFLASSNGQVSATLVL